MDLSTHKLEGKAHYVVDKWCGFLGSVAPSIIDLGLLPEVVIQITLASNTVCIDASNSDTTANFIIPATAGTAPVYKLTNMYAVCECIGMSDGTYESMGLCSNGQRWIFRITLQELCIISGSHTTGSTGI
jgi:hypothetical protein|eukprot:1504944-Prymnesium_polylepis.1